ncbi:hypothetical protein PV721_24795 [Streptomyces sp. MB09-01]|uniref:hypothetical protein n=1 Tax=Streptomyces sp. MB09-01 TaxID=3028666 RepID=UPI0029B47881|nr:hypothetical protein [Streptomyces sp. MB09-01]MDX3537531.1 hypothetical protein [Streptomyces sp. MB09-01]
MGNPYTGGRCARCVLGTRVDGLLGPELEAMPALAALAQCLADAPQPRSVIHWLDHSAAAQLLARLAADHANLTHYLLDALPQDPRTRYVRGLLVSANVLPERNEHLAQTELWVARTIKAVPDHQRRIIHAFAEWHTLKTARRQSARGRYTAGSAAQDRTEILRAIDFVAWLDSQGLSLHTATQPALDHWLTQAPGHRRGLVAFIRWVRLRRLADLTLTAPGRGLPQHFLGDHELHAQLHRCLTDEALPLDVRVAGSLIRLFALPASRIAKLTADAFVRDETGAYLTVNETRALLPPRLAALVEELISRPQSPAAVIRGPGHGPGYLFPGKTPGRPRSANSIRCRLSQHGLLTLAARNTAMITLISDMPPQIVSDLLGFSPSTTTQWAAYLQDSWSDYLVARGRLATALPDATPERPQT